MHQGSLSGPPIVFVMSVMGQEQTLAAEDFMSGLPPTTDIISEKADIGDSMSALGCKPDVI